MKTIIISSRERRARPTRTNPSTCPPLKAVINPVWTFSQQPKVVLELVYTAIFIPMKPARIEVPHPTRKAMAVYGALVGLTSAPIS